MSVQTVMARIQEIQGLLAPPPPATPATTGGTQSPTAFSAALAQAGTAAPIGATAFPATGGGAGATMVAAAQAEVGQAEQPPGSNDSPRIGEYRSATAGSGVGPWCAYFTSWLAKGAGVPLGEQGQGFGAVAAVWDWAQRTGKTVPAGQPPQPGDLIVWDGRHIGIVESVDPGGQIHTIEGNSSDRVSRRTYGPDGGGATGYVRVG
jgi:hypothetical protein